MALIAASSATMDWFQSCIAPFRTNHYMLAIASWNVNDGKGKKKTFQAIIDLAIAISTDPAQSGSNGEVLLCLLEPKNIDFSAILVALQATGKNWWLHQSPGGRFVILGTVSRATFQPALTEIKYAFPCKLTRMKGRTPYNVDIWFVHLLPPLNVWHPDAISERVAGDLRVDVEAREQANANTVLIGDFNLEPFSKSMVTPLGLNAAACRTVAKTANKTVTHHPPIQYFYNPMWELLGSFSPSHQPGSFLKRDQSTAVEWHLIDQVLVRPPMISSIQGKPKVLTHAGATRLTTAAGGIKGISDHLPVLVTLDI